MLRFRYCERVRRIVAVERDLVPRVAANEQFIIPSMQSLQPQVPSCVSGFLILRIGITKLIKGAERTRVLDIVVRIDNRVLDVRLRPDDAQHFSIRTG